MEKLKTTILSFLVSLSKSIVLFQARASVLFFVIFYALLYYVVLCYVEVSYDVFCFHVILIVWMLIRAII